MRIGELSATTGASVRSLRYYEEQQLICSRRTEGGQRVFDEDTTHRVAMIRCLIDAGVPTRDIGAMLPCVHSGTTTPTTLARLTEAHARLSAEMEERLATRDRLERIIAGVRDNTCAAAAAPA
ncbi:MerR family transcriptional regulator [uncultured Williamsia sp.]|uniref:MerR family transcriptional regulator n=1 Tax=uncultured Williamsia sp. TaxID=259311 RepID=UPI00261D0750|nr:MerR family transcriptional regulator [uncultured Williamsia sp.]